VTQLQITVYSCDQCDQCDQCGSCGVVSGICRHCGWTDPTYAPPATREWSEDYRARRLSKPCTLTSDIATFATPNDLMHPETD
jgi:hypothetical protein